QSRSVGCIVFSLQSGEPLQRFQGSLYYFTTTMRHQRIIQANIIEDITKYFNKKMCISFTKA
ncbi:MAG: hypothetical protein IIV43_07070, partial [Oscillospiraceae bacterium]|nr:hypothetical protein [Oscillospiraceae bacterium]